MKRWRQLLLRAAAVVCLVVALFPSYSYTETPTDDPVIPPAPPISSSETVLSLGLPFSPLFVYHDIYSWESSGDIPPKAGPDGQPVFTKGFTTRVQYTRRGGIQWISWSSALVVLAWGLLALAGRRKDGRVPQPEVTLRPPTAG